MRFRKMLLGLAICGLSISVFTACEANKKQISESDSQENIAYEEYFKLGRYEGFIIDVQKEICTDDYINTYLDTELKQRTQLLEVTDRDSVEKGDIIELSYRMFQGDNEIGTLEEGEEHIVVYPGILHDEIYKGLTLSENCFGHKKGETLSVSFIYPDYETVYYDENDHKIPLANQEGKLEITIHKIFVEENNKMNDAWVKTNTNYKSVKEYKKAIHDYFTEENEEILKREVKTLIYEEIEKHFESVQDTPITEGLHFYKEEMITSLLCKEYNVSEDDLYDKLIERNTVRIEEVDMNPEEISMNDELLGIE